MLSELFLIFCLSFSRSTRIEYLVQEFIAFSLHNFSCLILDLFLNKLIPTKKIWNYDKKKLKNLSNISSFTTRLHILYSVPKWIEYRKIGTRKRRNTFFAYLCLFKNLSHIILIYPIEYMLSRVDGWMNDNTQPLNHNNNSLFLFKKIKKKIKSFIKKTVKNLFDGKSSKKCWKLTEFSFFLSNGVETLELKE